MIMNIMEIEIMLNVVEKSLLHLPLGTAEAVCSWGGQFYYVLPVSRLRRMLKGVDVFRDIMYSELKQKKTDDTDILLLTSSPCRWSRYAVYGTGVIRYIVDTQN